MHTKLFTVYLESMCYHFSLNIETFLPYWYLYPHLFMLWLSYVLNLQTLKPFWSTLKYFLSIIIVARIMAPQICPYSNPQNLRLWQRNLVQVIKVKCLQMEKLSQIMRQPQCHHIQPQKLRTFLNYSQRIRENALCEGLSLLLLALRIGERGNEPRNTDTL